jgi:hypothetical protein
MIVSPVPALASISPPENDIALRTGVSSNEFSLFETKVICGEPPYDVNRVPYGLGADPHTRGSAQLFQTGQAGFPIRYKIGLLPMEWVKIA